MVSVALPRKIALIFAAAVFVVSGLAVVPPAIAVSATGTINFVDLDHVVLPAGSQAFGKGAMIQVHVHDTDLVGQTQTLVTVFSARDPTGETLVLLNDPDGDRSHFYGTFGVEETARTGNGQVAVANAEEIKARYQDVTPQASIETSPGALKWSARTTALLTLPSAALGTPGVTEIKVLDADQNTGPAVQAITVRVASTSDRVGFDLALTETTGQSGEFRATLPFKVSGPKGTSPLLVQPGDAVTVNYRDIDEEGRDVQKTATAVWQPAYNGELRFTDSTYRLPAAQVRGTGNAVGYIRYEDPDLAHRLNVNVTLKSSTAGLGQFGIIVPLTRTGVGTGEFVGSFGAATSSPAINQLLVSSGGETITATLTDPRRQDGTSGTRTATATWWPASTGTLAFRTSNYGDSAAGLSAADKGYLELVDLDLNTPAVDSAAVRIVSARDPVGLQVTLFETTATSGLFRGCFEFQAQAGGPGTIANALGPCPPEAPSASSAGRLLVRGNDVVTARYVDAATGDGRLNATLSVNGPPLTGTPASPSGEKGAISFKACTANCGTATPVLQPATALFGTGDPNQVFVEVNDPLHNRNPSSIESFSLVVGSTSAPVQWNSAGNLVPGAGIEVPVIETQSGSGIFRGSFGLTTGSGGPTTLRVGALDAFGDRLTAAYSYASHPDNKPAPPPTTPCGNPPMTACTPAQDRVGRGVVSQSIQWSPSRTATLELRDRRDGAFIQQVVGLSQVSIFLGGIDANEDVSGSINTVQVRVRSGSDPTGILVTLTERYAHAGDQSAPSLGHTTTDHGFIGTFTLTDSPSVDTADRLRVGAGDSILAEYVDPHTVNGAPAGITVSAPWLPGQLGVLTSNAEVYRAVAATSATIDVTDGDRNLDSSVAETIEVLVQTMDHPTDSAGRILVLTETTPSSAIFSAVLPFEATPVAGNAAIGPGDGGRVMLSYRDPKNTIGEPAMVQRQIRWFIDNHGGLLTLNAPTYATVSATGTITLADHDLDKTGLTDSVKVRLVSESDGAGAIIQLNETGGSTGIFTASRALFEAAREAGNGKVFVANGDRITVYAFDSCASATSGCGGTGTRSAGRIATATWNSLASGTPRASLVVSPASGPGPLKVNFTATAVGDSPVGYELDFGDGTSNAGDWPPPAKIPHTYAETGTYNATLEVTTESDLTDTATVEVTVTATTTTTTTTTSSTTTTTSSTTTTTTSKTGSTTDSTKKTLDGAAASITPEDLAAFNERIVLTVDRDGDHNVLRWQLPATDLPGPIAGVQLWRSNSPFVLVDTFNSSSSTFKARSFVDMSEDATPTSQYLLTMFFGDKPELGKFNETAPPDSALYLAGGGTDAVEAGLKVPWLPVLVSIGGVFLVVVMAVMISRGRRRQAEAVVNDTEPYPWDSALPPAPPPAPRIATPQRFAMPEAPVGNQAESSARCPSCKTVFAVWGQRPLAAECPSCGVRGVLR